MGIVISMLMITAGAIMRFAVSTQVSGFDIQTAGVVLIIVGAVAAALSIGFWASWGGFGGVGRRTVLSSRATVVSTPRTVIRQREVL